MISVWIFVSFGKSDFAQEYSFPTLVMLSPAVPRRNEANWPRNRQVLGLFILIQARRALKRAGLTIMHSYYLILVFVTVNALIRALKVGKVGRSISMLISISRSDN